MFSTVYGRERRNQNHLFTPIHTPLFNYGTETLQKSEMRHDFDENIFLNNIHLIPDPLKKNLADQLIPNCEEKLRKNHENPTDMAPKANDVQQSTMAGITSFFSGVFNMFSSAMFRSKSPVEYYDCVDGRQGSPGWQSANTNEQVKNGYGRDQIDTDMNSHCRTAASSCENKLNQVRDLLKDKPSNPIWLRKRPRKVFVEPSSVSESFEDAFSPEDFVSLPNDSFIEYYSPYQYHFEELVETSAQKTKVDFRPIENTHIVEDVECEMNLDTDKSNMETNELNLEGDKLDLDTDKTITDLDVKRLENTQNPILECDKQTNLAKENNLVTDVQKLNLENVKDESMYKNQTADEVDSTAKLDSPNMDLRTTNTQSDSPNSNCSIISNCEDKLAKLKALLQEKRKKKIEPVTEIPKPTKPADKRFKNPHRTHDKRKKSKIKQNIQEDMIFANEIDFDPAIEESPTPKTTCLGDYFDEVTGKFHSAATDDSFQIVLHDRVRIPSECDSEDSFIVFEDSPDSCYTSNEVFSDSDTDSDISDSGCSTLTCKLSHSLSRTVSNLTDDSLYVESSDEIDCAVVEPLKEVEVKAGLLLDDDKKRLRKQQPVKKVHFSADPPKVHWMRVWAFAARQARAGHWERYAVDRERFKRRIADTDMAVSWVLKPQHRSRVMFQRFMPWWNAEKRREAAEKKERLKREEEERLRIENERKLEEERVKELGEREEIAVGVEIGDENAKLDVKDDISDENLSPSGGIESKLINEDKNEKIAVTDKDSTADNVKVIDKPEISRSIDNLTENIDKMPENKTNDGLIINKSDAKNIIEIDKAESLKEIAFEMCNNANETEFDDLNAKNS